MRALAALTVYVSLAGLAFAGGWEDARRQAVQAFEAENYLQAVVAFRTTLTLAQTSAQRASSLYELGVALQSASQPREAIQPLQSALELWRANPEDAVSAFNAARAAETLAAVERGAGNYPGAMMRLRDALAWAPAGEAKVLIYCALGDLLREEGRIAEALALFTEASRLNGLPWQRQFNVMAGLGGLHRDAGDFELARTEWTKAADLARANGSRSLEAIAVRGLGEVWFAQHDYARAEPLLRKALAALSLDPAAGIQQSSTLAALAQLYMAENKSAMAEESLTRAIQLGTSCLGDRHPQVAALYRLLADSESQRGDFDAALRHMEQGRNIMIAVFGEHSPMAASMLAGAAAINRRANRLDAAAAAYRAALSVLDECGPDLAPLCDQVRSAYVNTLKVNRRKAEAQAIVAKADRL